MEDGMGSGTISLVKIRLPQLRLPQRKRSGPTGPALLPRRCGLCDGIVTEDSAREGKPRNGDHTTSARSACPIQRPMARAVPASQRPRLQLAPPALCDASLLSFGGVLYFSFQILCAPGISHGQDPDVCPGATKVPTLATDQSTNSCRLFVKQSTTPTNDRTARAWKPDRPKSMHLPRIPKCLEASLLRQTEVLCGPGLSIAHQPHSPTRIGAQHDFIAPSDPTCGDFFSLRVAPPLLPN